MMDAEEAERLMEGRVGALTPLLFKRLILDKCPTIDPIKHAHWAIIEYDFYSCSNCGFSYFNGCNSTKEAEEKLRSHYEQGYENAYEYCPGCGAMMDEVMDDATE